MNCYVWWNEEGKKTTRFERNSAFVLSFRRKRNGWWKSLVYWVNLISLSLLHNCLHWMCMRELIYQNGYKWEIYNETKHIFFSLYLGIISMWSASPPSIVSHWNIATTCALAESALISVNGVFFSFFSQVCVLSCSATSRESEFFFLFSNFKSRNI